MIDHQSEAFAGLVGRRIPVLDKGHVRLIDAMGSDADIVAAARKSYKESSRRSSSDRDLIRYMLRHHHGTPFERCELVLELVVPNGDTWRQMIRHRAASIWDESSMFDEPTVNAFSFRYGETPVEFQETPPDAWRAQSKDNKQGSAGFIPQGGYDLRLNGGNLTDDEATFHAMARTVYKSRLEAGVAYEQARKDLPNSIYTTAQWKCDLRNVLHFLALRMDGHAQQEVRAYAEAIGREIVAKLFPLTWAAFEQYVLGAVTLSALDVQAINHVAAGCVPDHALADLFANGRERAEARAKLVRLGLVAEGGAE